MAEIDTQTPAGGVRDDDDRAVDELKPEGSQPDDRQRKDERLDEGVEETFPASDPVAVKHIT